MPQTLGDTNALVQTLLLDIYIPLREFLFSGVEAMRYNLKVTAEHMSNCHEIIYIHFVDRSYVPFRLDGMLRACF